MKILIASDIHANLEPLQLMIRDSEFDYSIFLGDIVDYGTRPSETLDLIRSNFDRIVQGNHDNAAAYGVDCKCGQANHELSVYTRENITMKLMGENDLKYLRSLNTEDEFELEGLKISIAHGSPRSSLYEYVYPWNLKQEFFTTPLGSTIESDIFLLGHTHYQFFSQLRNSYIINPGSLGQPRDKDSRPAYCIYDTDTGNVDMRRMKYDNTGLRNEIIEMIPDQKMRDLNLKLFRLS